MPNTFITPTLIANRALATLYNSTVLAGLVYRDYDPDFSGKQGDTVTVRKPATFEAKVFDRDAGIELQDVAEDSFSVALDTILDVSFPVTTEELTLDIDDFQERLIAPAMEAVVQEVDARLANQIIGAAVGAGGGGTVTMGSVASDVFTGELGARAILGRGKIPTTQRYAVLSPEGAGIALQDDLFVAADKSGWTDALRDGSLGRVFGFDSYESQVFGEPGVGVGARGQADGAAFHRDAVALVSRTLERPQGLSAEQFAVANYKGLGLRVVRDYDISLKQDVVSIDFLCGFETIREEAAIKLEFGIGS